MSKWFLVIHNLLGAWSWFWILLGWNKSGDSWRWGRVGICWAVWLFTILPNFMAGVVVKIEVCWWCWFDFFFGWLSVIVADWSLLEMVSKKLAQSEKVRRRKRRQWSWVWFRTEKGSIGGSYVSFFCWFVWFSTYQCGIFNSLSSSLDFICYLCLCLILGFSRLHWFYWEKIGSFLCFVPNVSVRCFCSSGMPSMACFMILIRL